jgi:hypothetical protein
MAQFSSPQEMVAPHSFNNGTPTLTRGDAKEGGCGGKPSAGGTATSDSGTMRFPSLIQPGLTCGSPQASVNVADELASWAAAGRAGRESWEAGVYESEAR